MPPAPAKIMWDEAALLRTLRESKRLDRALIGKANNMRRHVARAARPLRTRDRNPRRKRRSALNAGLGYTHYVDGLKVMTGDEVDGLQAVYFIATHHGVVVEFGGADPDNPGQKINARHFMYDALMAERE